MKHSRRFSTVTVSLVVTTVALGVACRDKEEAVPVTPTGPPAACAISSDSALGLTRAAFVAWAATIPYDEPVDSLRGRPHGPGTSGITVYRARGMDRVTREQIQDGCLIARIQSATADSALGLGAGWTYVWADSTNPNTVTMVPEQEAATVTSFELSLLPSEPAPGDVASPRYICSDCGQDWCVYPRNGLQLEPVLFQPGGTGFKGGTEGRTLALSSGTRSP